MTIKTKRDGSIDLEDPATIEQLRSAEAVDTVNGTDVVDKPHHFTMSFTDAEAARLSRLSATGDWRSAIEETIQSLFHERVGRSVISSPSQYSAKITGPSSSAKFI